MGINVDIETQGKGGTQGLYWVGQEPTQAFHRQNTAWIMAGVWDISRALGM